MLPLIAELEREAARLLPADAYAYFASGSGDETTLGESVQAWETLRLRPRVLRDVAEVDLSVEVAGTRLSSPVLVAPMAFQVLAHPDGELATLVGAAAANSATVISTRCTVPLEEIGATATAPWWFQAYVLGDRSLSLALVERAAAAGARAVVLTGDTPVVAHKRRAPGAPPVSDAQFLTNLAMHLDAGAPAAALVQDPSVTLDAIGRLAQASGLPVLVKGVLRADDALECVRAGASGVVVSAHGGRQLDRVIPVPLALAEVAEAVAGSVPVLVDGGLRDGRSVLSALALGASAVMIGRPVLWALTCGGSAGVAQLLSLLTEDLLEAMRLSGVCRPGQLDRSFVAAPPAWR